MTSNRWCSGAAVEFLGRMRESTKPFFLYLPFQNIHGPYTCDAEFRQVRRTLTA